MPYVEGGGLRSRLQRGRPLPGGEKLRVAPPAARAPRSRHPHRQGVMHRDIKPENILLTRDGDTLVADFGIARARAVSEDHLTETGMSLGTPAYMSPEQASGDKTVDARTDVYSLGCVLYELLAGEPPYTGPTAQVVIMKRFTQPVPSVRKARPSVPEAVDLVIQRALAPVPADRFATSGEFARALQVQVSGLTAAAAGPTTVPGASAIAAPTTFAAPA